LPPPWTVNPRPEIVLPPGFALRIDYDPESSPASLLITAYRDDAPVGQAHVDPREVGQRLRLDVADETAPPSTTHELRLRLTPQRAQRAIVMDAVRDSAPSRAVVDAVEEAPPLPVQPAIPELPAMQTLPAVSASPIAPTPPAAARGSCGRGAIVVARAARNASAVGAGGGSAGESAAAARRGDRGMA
jgi:hypothetical protein